MTFNTKRDNELTAQQRFQMAVEAKQQRVRNLDTLGQKAVLESQAVDATKELELIDEACAKKESKIKALETMESAAKCKRRKEKQATLEQKLVKEGVDFVTKMVLFEMSYNAYVADEDFKDSKTDELLETFEVQLAVLEAKCGKKAKSKFLQEVDSVVEAVCKKAAKRIVKEEDENEEIDSIQFNLNEEEEDELQEKLTELGKDEIENLVKEKVIQVVKDEKQQNIKKAETIQAIDDELSEITEDKAEEELTVEESFKVRALNKKKNSVTNVMETSLFGSIMIDTTIALEQSIATESVTADVETVMSSALVESLYKYTVLETAFTLGLYEFTEPTIKSLSSHYRLQK